MRTLLALGPPAVAVLLVALMAVPASAWRNPQVDVVYRGFDSRLIFTKESGPRPAAGKIALEGETLFVTALPDSQPVAHFATTPLDRMEAEMEVRISASAPGTVPLRIGIWSPRSRSGYFLRFGPEPGNEITAEAISGGIPASTLLAGDIIKSESLGVFTLDQPHRLQISMDKDAGIIRFGLAAAAPPPGDAPALRLAGGPTDPAYSDAVSAAVRVRAGNEYILGGLANWVSGRDAYKMALQWLDRNKEHIGFAGDWRSVQGLEPGEWVHREERVKAPEGAVYARMYLGAGNGTRLFFAEPFLARSFRPGENLIAADFGEGSWAFVSGKPFAGSVMRAQPGTVEASITEDDLPALFGSLRLSLTASALSPGGQASAVLTDYSLSLPHQRFYGVKVNDLRAKGALAVLLALGALLGLLQAARTLSSRRQRRADFSQAPATFLLRLRPAALWAAAGVLLYLVANALLFRLGSHPFDMTGQVYWTHIAARYGLDDLYYLPNLASLAVAWNGGPWHEASFPYGAVMAYFFAAIGWAQRIFLEGPGAESGSPPTAILVKAGVLLFGLADAWLIYLVLLSTRLPRRTCLIAAGLFLFNPAVWFSISLWGQTHVVSVFFLLLAVLMVQRRQPTAAWLGIGAAVLTRPQMLVPAFLLALVLLRRFPLQDNARAASWTVIGASLLLAPMTLAISPSLPVDILLNQFHFQESGGNEASQRIVSLGAYSIWPVLTNVFAGAHGLARFHQPSGSSLLGPLTYQQAGSILTAATVLACAALILLRRGARGEPAGYLLPLALGTGAFLMLKTGLASTHFIIGLPLIILCAGAVRGRIYYPVVATWSLLALVAMYGGLGFALPDVPHLAPALHAGNNPLTRLAIELHAADWFITSAGSANLLALLLLATGNLHRPAPAGRDSILAPRGAVVAE